MMSDAEARRAARELREEIDREGWESAYSRYCAACRERVPLEGWPGHIISGKHQENELARQEAQLKKHPWPWQRQNWPLRPDDTKWCPTCERNILVQDWYAHLESHRIRVRRKKF